MFHPKWWTAAHLNPQDNNELQLTISDTVSAAPHPYPPANTTNHPAINRQSTLEHISIHPSIIFLLLLLSGCRSAYSWEQPEEEEEETALCWKNNFGLWRMMKILNANRKKAKWFGPRLWWVALEAEPKRGRTPGGYLVMGASKSTGFFISNDRAGAHCSSLKPGDTLTRVLPLCVEKRKPHSQTNALVGFGWFMGQCVFFLTLS